MTFCCLNGDLVARVSVSDHAHAWVRGQDSFQPASRSGSSICNNDLSGVLAVPHPYAAAMME